MEITKAKLKQFLKDYDVGSLINFKKIELGLMNEIYSVQVEKGNFILKISVQNNVGNRLDYELELLNFFHGLQTPKPIARKDSKLWSCLGKNKAFLMERMPGEHKKIITENDLKNVGAFLGKMHNQTLRFKSDIKRLETLSYSAASLGDIYRKCANIKDDAIVEALGYIKKNIEKFVPPAGIEAGAIHSDLKPENCLFKNNKLSGVVDFDNSYIAPLAIDLANTIIWFCADAGKLDTQKAAAIASSYQSVRKITNKEKSYLLKAIHFVYLRNLLRGIEYYSMKKVEKDLVYWAIDNFLEAEQRLPKKFNT